MGKEKIKNLKIGNGLSGNRSVNFFFLILRKYQDNYKIASPKFELIYKKISKTISLNAIS
jgi:hypothetical protein